MAAAQSELSMDEILASIRKIIHDEDEPRLALNPDKTNTVNLREQPAAPQSAQSPAPSPEPGVAEQLRQVQVTSAEPAAAPAEPSVAASEAQTAQPAQRQPAAPAPAAEPQAAPLAQTTQATQAPAPAAPEPVPAEVGQPALQDQQPEPEPEPAAVATMEPDAVATEHAAATDTTFDEDAKEKLQASEPTIGTKPSAQDQASSLLDEAVSSGAALAFAQLRQGVELSKGTPRTLEDMVQEMMRPMLKAWLDEHLRAIVEEKVEAEIAKVAGRKG
jgi:cell pole-organizing protein PopZ